MPHSHAPDDLLRSTLAAVAPGGELRDGLERILRGRTGALIVLGFDQTVESICSGGFVLDVEFSATRLRELAKMDGAVVVDAGISRILRAAVQLLPDVTIETSESGTRHRTAERVAKQTGLPVVSVSASMRIIALYVGGQRHVIEDSTTILSRANQALATLERYKSRLDEVSGTLSALEIEDLVTVRDVSAVVQRLEMVRRISEEIEGYVVELGTDGRLLTLQLDELVGGIGSDRALIIRDYVDTSRREVDSVLDELAELDSHRAARQRPHRQRPGPAGRRRRARRGRRPARLPPAVQGPAPARRDRRPPGRALRRAAEAARGRHRGPHGRRRRRRAARPGRARGTVAARGVQHPRAVRLARRRPARTRPAGALTPARFSCAE